MICNTDLRRGQFSFRPSERATQRRRSLWAASASNCLHSSTTFCRYVRPASAAQRSLLVMVMKCMHWVLRGLRLTSGIRREIEKISCFRWSVYTTVTEAMNAWNPWAFEAHQLLLNLTGRHPTIHSYVCQRMISDARTRDLWYPKIMMPRKNFSTRLWSDSFHIQAQSTTFISHADTFARPTSATAYHDSILTECPERVELPHMIYDTPIMWLVPGFLVPWALDTSQHTHGDKQLSNRCRNEVYTIRDADAWRSRPQCDRAIRKFTKTPSVKQIADRSLTARGNF